MFLKATVLLCIFIGLSFGNECHQTFVHQPSGMFASPNYPRAYPNDAFCNYRIDAKQGEHIQFSVNEMQASTDSAHDFLMIFDGPDCMSKRLGVYTSTSSWPLTSTSNEMTALFVSDFAVADKGFEAKYITTRTVSDAMLQHSSLYFTSATADMLLSCGGELPAENKSFSIPPSNRLPNVCIWRITAMPHQTINVTITNTQALSGKNFLRILDGGSCDKKPLLYAHSVYSNKRFTVHSTQNQVIIFLVRQPGAAANLPLNIEYTMSNAPQKELKPLSELTFFTVPDYEQPAGAQTSKFRYGTVAALAVLSLWVVWL